MKIRLLMALVAASVLSAPAFADTFFVDCNQRGLDKMSDEQAAKVFWNRFANKGKGNGGESIDVVVDLTTGDITVTCVSTEDEDTAGRVSLLFPDGALVDIGPVMAGEIDPDNEPGP